MYLKHFGLSKRPFQPTPDIEFLYVSEAHRHATAYMHYTVRSRDGFAVVTGDAGCGKSILVQKLVSDLSVEDVLVAKVFQTQLDEVEFLQSVLVEFGMNPFKAGKVELLDMLNTFLIEQFRQNRQVVVVVDDAHNLGIRVLEEIRMLTGLETQDDKFMHVILVGQPGLVTTLDHPMLAQLDQRVKLRCNIGPLTESELGDYIHYRLNVAGVDGNALIAWDLVPVIYRYTGGIPRLVNTLCDASLTGAYADGARAITLDILEEAVKELQWLPYAELLERRRRTWPNEQSGGPADVMRDGAGVDRLADSVASLDRTLAAIQDHLSRSTPRAAADAPGQAAVTDKTRP